jgi:MSHA biogenesis protein MshJ
MAAVDQDLLALTSGLINPIQMRYALIDLLKLQKGVSLLSFEVIKAQPLTVPASNKKGTEGVTVNESNVLTLYKHGIKLKIKGNYFQLRDYLIQLEQLEWTFFWQTFDYQLIQYPNSELIIEMYSLSTHKEFIGV